MIATTLKIGGELKRAMEEKGREHGITPSGVVALGLKGGVVAPDPGVGKENITLRLPEDVFRAFTSEVGWGKRAGAYRGILDAWVRGELELKLCAPTSS